mmetsp:Transcript_8019/g.36459  ORF Transcript_8019/g.36459 Transcript_8019/m.36459 type:complete len:104 (+) Transcript_8019:3370-3681(+)
MREDNLEKSVELTRVDPYLFAHYRVYFLPSKNTFHCEVTVNDSIQHRACPLPATTINIRKGGITQPFKEYIHSFFNRQKVSIKNKICGIDGIFKSFGSRWWCI